MNTIIKILMKRDGVSYEEAKEMYEDCRAEIFEYFDGTSCVDPEEILEYELGLEPDYLDCFF